MTDFFTGRASLVDNDLFFVNTPCRSSRLPDAVVLFARQVAFPASSILLLIVACFSVNIVRPYLIKLDGLLNAIGRP